MKDLATKHGPTLVLGARWNDLVAGLGKSKMIACLYRCMSGGCRGNHFGENRAYICLVGDKVQRVISCRFLLLGIRPWSD